MHQLQRPQGLDHASLQSRQTRTNTLMWLALALALTMALVGCSASARIDGVEREVAKFHQLLDQEQFETIWHQGSTEFQKVAKREDFVAFIGGVHKKLGQFQSSAKQSWHVNYTTDGTMVTLTYKSQFAEGEAHERFIYRHDGSTAQLMRYEVNSNVFVLK